MDGHGRQDTWDHQGVPLPVGGRGRDAVVLRRGEIQAVGADMVPDFLCVARRFVAVEVTQVTVDFIQVPLLRDGLGLERERTQREKAEGMKEQKEGARKRQEKKMEEEVRSKARR